MRNWVLGFVVACGALAGCGDNSRSCGDGTVEMSGYCVPAAQDGAVTCGTGTKLDPVSGTCQIDPTACQNGTVLIDSVCTDPTLGTSVDLEEGPEPNGLGVLEASGAPAGVLSLKAAGEAFIVHGMLNVAGTSDVDSYIVDVTEPTLVHVQVSGPHGTAAGLIVTSPDLAGWKRFAMSVAGYPSPSAGRDVYLPRSGRYYVSVSDTSTVISVADGGGATSGVAAEDYYLTIAKLATPPPVPLTTTASGSLETIQFYSATVANGSHAVTLAMPSTFAVASVVVAADMFLAFADEDTQPARLTVSGLGATLIVVDDVYDVSPAPVAFQLTIQ